MQRAELAAVLGQNGKDEPDGIDTRVGYWANFYRLPMTHIDTSGWTDGQRESFIAELERQNEEHRVEVMATEAESARERFGDGL